MVELLNIQLQNFFEIPIRNSVLISQNIKGLNPLGFKNGSNIIISEPDQLAKVEKWLVNNPKKMKNCYEWTKINLNKHIYESRIKYIKVRSKEY